MLLQVKLIKVSLGKVTFKTIFVTFLFLGSDESGNETYGMGGYGTIQDAKERSQV